MRTNPAYQNWIKVGISVLLVGIAMAMVQYKVPTIMLSLMKQYSMDANEASWLMSILCLVMIPLAIPSGLACSKYGPRRCILFATGLMVAGTLLGAFTSNAVLLMADRAFEGAAICILTVCAPVLIGQTVDPARNGSALGLWGMWGPLGSALAALITPSIYVIWGTTGLWLAYTMLVVGFTMMMLLLVKAPASSPMAQGEGEVPDAVSRVRPPSLRRVFTRDTMLFFCGFIAFNIVLLAVLSYVPTILQNKGMDPTMSGLVSTLPMILSVVSSPLFGVLSDRTGKTKLLLIVTMAFLGPCAFVLYNFTGTAMWAAAVIMGLIGMGSSGLVIAAFMKVLPDPRLAERGMGVLITMQGIGQFLGAFLVQLLLGPQMDYLLTAGLAVMALALGGTLCLAFAHFGDRVSRPEP